MATGTAAGLPIRDFACLLRKRPSFDMTVEKSDIHNKSIRTNRFNQPNNNLRMVVSSSNCRAKESVQRVKLQHLERHQENSSQKHSQAITPKSTLSQA